MKDNQRHMTAYGIGNTPSSGGFILGLGAFSRVERLQDDQYLRQSNCE